MQMRQVELTEHENVQAILKGLGPERRCWRRVGDVLVERTAGEVEPAIARNGEGLRGEMAKLEKEIVRVESEYAAFKAKHNITIRGEGGK